MRKNILIIAGETSGDIHAANLIKHLKELNPDLVFFGIGGKEMEKEGTELLERMEKLSIIGVSEILPKLSLIRRAYKKIIDKVKETRPDIVILIDYPGFNLVLARKLKKLGLRVVYYITPQVWAWGKFRVYFIKKYIDKAVVILKFEEELFRKYKIDATFVGHPLLDSMDKGAVLDRKLFGLEEGKTTIALLPGSRESEVLKMLPVMLKTAHLILKEISAQFILLKSPSVDETIYNKILEGFNVPILSIKDNVYGCLSMADFVFTASGTATLESAIMEKPMLITYKTSLLTAILFKIFARTEFIGLVNIIAQGEIAPEILQYDARPKRLATEILSIISSKEKQKRQIQNLRQVKYSLGTKGASLRAARVIEDLLKQQQ